MTAYPDIDLSPPVVTGTFPLIGPPRFYGLYEIEPYDTVEPPPRQSTYIGWGVQFAGRAITLVRGTEHERWALGVHASATEAAAFYSLNRPVRVHWMT